MTNAKRFALLSVYHKDGIVEFAAGLIRHNFVIYASGGTSKALTDAGIENIDVATLVGGGAILGHKVVTLSREVHAGLLADPASELEEMERLGLPFIDLVCVDLYPLEEAINSPDATTASVLSKTDIGGPTMLSSAAKGRRIVVCDPADRTMVLDWIANGKRDDEMFITALCAKADFVVASYRLLSARFHSNGKYNGITGIQHRKLRYGENAMQAPAYLYKTNTDDPLAIPNFVIHTGNPSLINMTDVDRSLQTLTHLMAAIDVNGITGAQYAGVAVKHGNACGAAATDNPLMAIRHIIDGNRKSIFGGTVMVNFAIGEDEAIELIEYGLKSGQNRRPLDVVIASSVTQEAIEILSRKNDRCLILTNPALGSLDRNSLDTSILRRQVRGGWLQQPNYTSVLNMLDEEISVHGTGEFDAFTTLSTLIGWAVCATSNSNTIALARRGVLLSCGVGQKDRVEAAELAVKIAREAGHDTNGSVAVSDSFFPFPDGPQVLLDAGVVRLLATSGSTNDAKIIELFKGSKKCELLHIPDAKGRMFYGH